MLILFQAKATPTNKSLVSAQDSIPSVGPHAWDSLLLRSADRAAWLGLPRAGVEGEPFIHSFPRTFVQYRCMGPYWGQALCQALGSQWRRDRPGRCSHEGGSLVGGAKT